MKSPKPQPRKRDARASKFDMFILYNERKNKLFTMVWDCAYDGIDSWFYQDGKTNVRLYGNGHISGHVKRNFIILDRIPEAEWRS